MPTATYDLVGSAEAAEILEIGPTNFSHLRSKMKAAGDDTFPAPIVDLRCGPIWKRSDILKFQKHYEARRRRVRSTNGDTATAVETPALPVKSTAKVRKAQGKAPTKTTAKATAAKPRKLAAKKLAAVPA
jgi:hypothetical protein